MLHLVAGLSGWLPDAPGPDSGAVVPGQSGGNRPGLGARRVDCPDRGRIEARGRLGAGGAASRTDGQRKHAPGETIFAVNVPIAVVALAAGPFIIPESRDPHPASPDVIGALLSIGTISTLVYGIIEASKRRTGAGPTRSP